MALRSRRTAFVALAVLVVAAVAAAVAVPQVLAARRRAEAEQLRAAVAAYASAWRAGTLGSLPYASGAPATVSAPAEVAKQVGALTAGLTPAAKDLPAGVDVQDVPEPRDGAATAALAVRWSLGGGATWRYRVQLPMRLVDGTWRVAWSPAVVHPSLTRGLVLTAARTPAPRGRVLGAGGRVLVEEREVVHVGIDPGRARDRAATARAVAALVRVDAAALQRRVVAGRSGQVVDVITLRRPDYDAVRDRLRPIPGTVFRQSTLPLAPSAGFARALLGSVGAASAEAVAASKGRLRAGDLTGLSGLQRTYDERLAGRAGLRVTAVAATGAAAVTPAPTPPTAPLLEQPAVPGEDVTIGLDVGAQQAAEAALARAPQPAALVALRPSTGEVLAVANGGPNGADYNRALLGQYPPGSTFKIVSTLGLLGEGVTPATPIACPAELVVQGKTFRNAEGEVLGTVPFSTDFALSCNTAFVGSAGRLSSEALARSASALGFGATTSLGLPAYGGSVPVTDGAVEHAAQMIGQGKVLASPLTVALTSASVAAGRRVSPRLVLDPAPAAPAPGAPLPAGRAADLRALMRAVVTTGTGSAVRSVPGGPVHGKTGTAEFGTADPPLTHAWFTGYQGDVAFAVVVENGGFGGRVATPLAAAFLTGLAAR